MKEKVRIGRGILVMRARNLFGTWESRPTYYALMEISILCPLLPRAPFLDGKQSGGFAFRPDNVRRTT